MTDAVRYPLVLGTISLCSAAGLALSYSLTRDEIRFQEELKKAQGLAEVFGVELDGTSDERPWKEFKYPDPRKELGGDLSVYELADAATGRGLYAAEGAGQGYSSKVRVVVAVDQGIERSVQAARILRIKVISQLETPGLGSKCEDPEFQRQFWNLPRSMLGLIKNAPYRDPEKPNSDEAHVAAITGATITSNAVVAAIRQALARIRHHIENRPKNGLVPLID
jgi:electron transport complex protein RnfG